MQHSYEDFSKGNSKGVALRSSGVLELAPAFTTVFTSPSSFLWDIVAAPDGTLYAAAGAPARVYRIAKDGSATVIFEPKELQVQALALDKNGVLYAATSPDGKIYRIEKSAVPAASASAKPAEEKKDGEAASVPVDPSYTATVFFEPKTKYIWDLAFGPDGRLFVATGDRGEIFAVTAGGEGKVFFKSDEAHIRKLAIDAKGTLYAGSDGSGLIYRVSPAGEGFVLFSANKKEITALAFGPEGDLYAAAVGEKRGVQPQPGMPMILPQGPMPLPNMAPASPMIGITATGGSEVYRISVDGSPSKLWAGKDDIVYGLILDRQGRILSGSGNKGRILSLEQNGDFVELAKASATQVTGFAASGNSIYAASSNLGKIFQLGGDGKAEGSYESDVFDAHLFTQWGRVEVRGRSQVEIYARSGNVDNPDRNWSPWKKVALTDGDGRLDVPAARFLQWKAVFAPATPNAQLDSVKVYYRSKNAPPSVDDVAVQAGARFNVAAMPRPQNESVMVSVGPQQPQAMAVNPSQPKVEPPLAAQKDRAFVAVRWAATDENGDDLLYSVYYRGDGESRWRLLKDKITDKFYSFDSSLLPDGGYQVRVVASDSPSHTPEEALSDFRDSERFEVDNSPPRIDGLTATLEGGKLHVAFSATDTFSSIQRAEFALDAGDWQFVEPVGQISDARTERYQFQAALPKPGPAIFADAAKGTDGKTAEEHVVVVRVFDRFDNMAIAKVVVR